MHSNTTGHQIRLSKHNYHYFSLFQSTVHSEFKNSEALTCIVLLQINQQRVKAPLTQRQQRQLSRDQSESTKATSSPQQDLRIATHQEQLLRQTPKFQRLPALETTIIHFHNNRAREETYRSVLAKEPSLRHPRLEPSTHDLQPLSTETTIIVEQDRAHQIRTNQSYISSLLPQRSGKDQKPQTWLPRRSSTRRSASSRKRLMLRSRKLTGKPLPSLPYFSIVISRTYKSLN